MTSEEIKIPDVVNSQVVYPCGCMLIMKIKPHVRTWLGAIFCSNHGRLEDVFSCPMFLNIRNMKEFLARTVKNPPSIRRSSPCGCVDGDVSGGLVVYNRCGEHSDKLMELFDMAPMKLGST